MASCGAWTKAQAHRPQFAADGSAIFTARNIDLIAQTSWVQGFLTGFNAYGGGSGGILRGTDKNGAFAWLDNYCEAHPLDTVVTATMELISELSSRVGAR